MTFASVKPIGAEGNPFAQAKIRRIPQASARAVSRKAAPTASSGYDAAWEALFGAPKPSVRAVPSEKTRQRQENLLHWILATAACLLLALTLPRMLRQDSPVYITLNNLPPVQTIRNFEPVKRFVAFVQPKPQTPKAVIPPAVIIPVQHAFVSSRYGRRWGRMHQGVDYAANYGEPIRPVMAGKVVFSGWESGYGRTVLVDHGHGLTTRYAHCSSTLIAPGKKVTQATVIAKVGSTGHSTGPHLHFEVLQNGVRRDPLVWLASKRQKPVETTVIANKPRPALPVVPVENHWPGR